AVKRCSMDAVEFWGFASKNLDEVKAASKECGVTVTSMCVDSSDESLASKYRSHGLLFEDSGERLRHVSFESVERARELGVKNLIVTAGQARDDISREEQHANIVNALRCAVPIFERAGVNLILEPLNTITNHRGHYLSSSYEGFGIIREVGSDNVKLLYDIYHQQITEGNLIPNITKNIGFIGHFHAADNPGRNEPGTGEINYRNVFAAINASGYNGYIGLEYEPTQDSAQSLKDFSEAFRC
ncbi:MAG: TIM barrel protein, partial [Clostridiales bacterium]|nr:TIM barrel protein [Clostridiales bacterium]